MGGGLIAKIVKRQGHIGNIFANQCHSRLQVVALRAGDAHFFFLNRRLYLNFAVFNQFLQLLCQFTFDAIAHLNHLLDLIAPNFLRLAYIQKAHIHFALGEFVAQQIFDLGQLEFGITKHGNFFVFQLYSSRSAFKVKAGADFFRGILYRIFDLHKIGFTNGIKRRHGGFFSKKSDYTDRTDRTDHTNRGATIWLMLVEKNASLQPYNTFGILAHAETLVCVRHTSDLHALRADPVWGSLPWLALGGGSNIVLTGNVKPVVLKIEILGRRLVEETEHAWVIEAGAGESWHDTVAWTLAQGWPGLENLALIPGTVGAAPVQNIGAYGVELQDRFDSLDAIDVATGECFTLNAVQCAFAYRDSVFKQGGYWAGRAVITRVRLRLPKLWQPALGYAELKRCCTPLSGAAPTPQQIFEAVCEIRRAKLPDPAIMGSAGSFFKNPTVTPEQGADLIASHPQMVHYPLPDGSIKLAAGWLIDSCGWKGKTKGQAAVYEKQALVLVSLGRGEANATGAEVMALAQAIQDSVYGRFGVRLDPEPVLI